MRQGRGAYALVLGLACVAAAAWLGPYAWMIVTSFKTLPEIVAHPTAPLPEHLDAGAYREVFAAIPVGRYMAVTVFMAVAIACLLVPAQATFVPVFLFFARVRLVDTMTALVVPFAASALGTFLVRQALLGVPDEIIEAARMDGASEWTIVYRILAPLLTPTLVSLFLVSFVFHYNDYFWPLVMTTGDSVRTLPLGVALLREQGTGVRWHIVMAGNVVLSLPVLALFAVAQQHLVRAVSARR